MRRKKHCFKSTDFSFASRKEQNPLHETLANPLITFAALFVSLALAEDFKTTNGKEYKNATVMLVEPDGITLRSKSGVSKVYFNELPKEVQERFHYDPQKAAAASAEQAASIQQANQQIEESNKQREKEKQVALESSRRATEEAAKAQNTTIEPGNKTATGRNIVGVGGVNGLEVEMSRKERNSKKCCRTAYPKYSSKTKGSWNKSDKPRLDSRTKSRLGRTSRDSKTRHARRGCVSRLSAMRSG